MYLITNVWTGSVLFCLDSLQFLGCDHQAFQVFFSKLLMTISWSFFSAWGNWIKDLLKLQQILWGNRGEYDIAFCLVPAAKLLCIFICWEMHLACWRDVEMSDSHFTYMVYEVVVILLRVSKYAHHTNMQLQEVSLNKGTSVALYHHCLHKKEDASLFPSFPDNTCPEAENALS